MRRSEIIRGSIRVIEAVTKSRLPDVLELALRGARSKEKGLSDNIIQEILKFHEQFVTMSNDFGTIERRIFRIFGLEPIFDADFWALVIAGATSSAESHQLVSRVRRSAWWVREFLPRMIELIQREADRRPISIHTEKKEIVGEKMTLFIREQEAPNLTTKQFVQIMEAIDELYAIITKVYHIEHSELVVGSLDSGSDKSLDVIGIAKAVEKLSALFLECWDRIRYRHGTLLHANSRAALEGLSVISEIQALQAKKAISDEEAEALTRGIVRNMQTLFKSGVYTSKMEEQRPISPSEIPVERKKLITYSPPEKGQGSIGKKRSVSEKKHSRVDQEANDRHDRGDGDETDDDDVMS